MAKRILVGENISLINITSISNFVLFFFPLFSFFSLFFNEKRAGNPYRLIPPNVFDMGVAKYLPKAYQKFYWESQEEPTPIHFIPKAGRYVRDERTGLTKPVQNVPIPMQYPEEFDECLLGGEGIIKGFYKTKRQVKKFPHFWIPTLKRTAVYSEILNQHMDVLATDRVIQLIHHYKGFDEYIMQVS